jgi:hypothetical protein
VDLRIKGLDAAPFQYLFDLDDQALAAHGAMRQIADADPGYPCRISLTDAPVGAEVILVNYEHQSAPTPYRARHAIYVRRDETPFDAVDNIPKQLRSRTLSLRAFDAVGFICGGDLVEGAALEAAAKRLLSLSATAYVHVHFAKYGCYAARIERT